MSELEERLLALDATLEEAQKVGKAVVSAINRTRAAVKVGRVGEITKGLGAISQALEKMKTGHRRESLQLRERELERVIHHAVDQETIFFRIDLRNNGATVSTHKMERGGRNRPH